MFDLCAANLQDYCNRKYNGEIPSDAEVLFQLSDGLHYIHSKKIIHRDIKPENILISKTTLIKMKWADFGLSKPTNSHGSFSMSGFRGTYGWIAPEILHLSPGPPKGRGTKQSDIFSAGCVFFFFLTRGTHPFGNQANDEININIRDNNMVNGMSKFHLIP